MNNNIPILSNESQKCKPCSLDKLLSATQQQYFSQILEFGDVITTSIRPWIFYGRKDFGANGNVTAQNSIWISHEPGLEMKRYKKIY